MARSRNARRDNAASIILKQELGAKMAVRRLRNRRVGMPAMVRPIGAASGVLCMWGRERWRITVPHRPSALYKRPLQVWRYLRQFPSPRSPNSSLLRQACRNSAHASLRTGRWQVSRYLRQFPSPRSPRAPLFSQARRNCSHSPPRIRTPPGTISSDWESAETGITKRATAAAAPNAAGIIASPLPPPLGGAHLNGWTGLSPLTARPW